ncbi:hypothetical protein NP233_g3056 [Leucocoprinus birnbaumii]|uniref:Uncharacterized protein n=1 Tax=Leucocoprinus birnbaumii TaxID=56174 RepID=A0AAD5YWR7_9AGAR|nr:hypothetical protein NP233_g3056 [Leucocoprinus birnbaumii]
MLTRPQFDAACNALIARYAESPSDSVAISPMKGWTWNEHTEYPNFGYLGRTVNVFRRPENLAQHSDDCPAEGAIEEVDPTVLETNPTLESFVCQQYIVFSSTFRVPAFYFLLFDSSGAPVPLPSNPENITVQD